MGSRSTWCCSWRICMGCTTLRNLVLFMRPRRRFVFVGVDSLSFVRGRTPRIAWLHCRPFIGTPVVNLMGRASLLRGGIFVFNMRYVSRVLGGAVRSEGSIPVSITIDSRKSGSWTPMRHVVRYFDRLPVRSWLKRWRQQTGNTCRGALDRARLVSHR